MIKVIARVHPVHLMNVYHFVVCALCIYSLTPLYSECYANYNNCVDCSK